MIICHTHKFIYFAPEKTGSTSIRKVLSQNFAIEIKGGVHDIFLPSQYSDYFTFCTVRNPYTRALSAYNHMMRDGLGLPIEECCTIGNWHWARPIFNSLFKTSVVKNCVATHLDAFVKTENMEEDFNLLPFVNKNVSIPTLNQSNKYRVAYGLKVFEWVSEFYKADFDFFGYQSGWIDMESHIFL